MHFLKHGFQKKAQGRKNHPCVTIKISIIDSFGAFQLQLELVCDECYKFRIRGFALFLLDVIISQIAMLFLNRDDILTEIRASSCLSKCGFVLFNNFTGLSSEVLVRVRTEVSSSSSRISLLSMM